MANYGESIQHAFKGILKSAIEDIGEFKEFVHRQRLPRPIWEDPGILTDKEGYPKENSQLEQVLDTVAVQFFQDPDNLRIWIQELRAKYGASSKVKEALELYEQELSKPALWIIEDERDQAKHVLRNEVIKKTIAFILEDRYRLDVFDGLRDRFATRDRNDFERSGCIVISWSDGKNGNASDLIYRILGLAFEKVLKKVNTPKIVFTTNKQDRAVTLEEDVSALWLGSPPPPFLFLIPGKAEIAALQQKALEFFESRPPPVHDLVILVGCMSPTDNDVDQFNRLKGRLGDNEWLIAFAPWRETDTLSWNDKFEMMLSDALNPIVIEHIGEGGSDDRVFFRYLIRAAITNPDRQDTIIARAQTIPKRRILWKPAGPEFQTESEVELRRESPEELAHMMLHRLGDGLSPPAVLGEELSPPAVIVVEDVIIGQKRDVKLLSALNRHLSIIACGDGRLPSTDWVTPLSFMLAPTGDPLHKAVERFRRSTLNIVVAYDISRGTRPLARYLAEISTRVLDGINMFFSGRADIAPDPSKVLHILVKIADIDGIDTELVDDANGIWRIVKFRLYEDEYVPFPDDFTSAQAWVKSQL
ncbi:hypothetical protein [Rhizobium leguminosarum]|uniref:hypothetical protein n=1 Tax=Rhizobium leguminosarum TaxID=384 RepID=UPI0012F7C9B7|nr:hypothetical protein [Rhizobium leguminosarum]MVO95499.1 hypothetical protein [Rhizobium leguminosarum bv. phaseoli]